MKYAHIAGWGRHLPDQVMTNHDLAEIIDTSHEWIAARTGIHRRRIAGAEETTASLAFEAAAKALAVAGLAPAQVELIIVATSTAEHAFPSTASLVQDYLGARRAGAFDLGAACSGFVYALDMAAQAIATGSVKNALVIGAETMSRVLDWEDRATCILFGDGAGAVVLTGSSVPGGVLASALRSDGSGGNLLQLPTGYDNGGPLVGNRYQNGNRRNTVRMNGRQVFRFATRVMADVIAEVVKEAELTLDDVALIIPHQANARIIETAARRLGLPMDAFYLNVEALGNTSAASIPLALCDAVADGRLQPDDNIVFVGFGGGLTWAAAVVKWDVTPPPVSPLRRRWDRTRYALVRGRSRLRRWGRKFAAWVAGSPTPDARLKDATKKPPEDE